MEINTHTPESFSGIDQEQVKRIIVESNNLPYSYHSILPQTGLVNLALDQLRKGSDDRKAIFTAEIDEQLVGIGSVQGLVWDTNALGIKTAKVGDLFVGSHGVQSRSLILREMASAIVSWLRDEGYSFAWARVKSDEIIAVHSLEQAGFNLIESLLTFGLNLSKRSSGLNYSWIRAYEPCDYEELRRITIESYTGSRFRRDPNLTKDQVERVLSAWIESAAAGRYADTILVAEDEEGTAGYVVCRIKREVEEFTGIRLGSVNMIAVAPHRRHQGFGTALMSAALTWLGERADLFEVSTGSTNNQAINLYVRCGLNVLHSRFTFHRSVIRK